MNKSGNLGKTITFSLPAVLLSALLAACVTEQVSGPFKPPTKESLDKAALIYIDLAYQHIEKKNYEQSMYNVQRALEINPGSVNAHMALAQTYQYQGDTEKARDAFKKAISLDNSFSPVHVNYGKFLYEQKEYKAACKEFEMASANDFYEKRADAFGDLGVCRMAIGDLAGAEEALKRSIAIDEKQWAVFLELSEIKFNQKMYPEAKEYFDKHNSQVRAASQTLSPRALWLGMRLEKIFGNTDAEASMGVFLRNAYPYSKEALEYQESLKK